MIFKSELMTSTSPRSDAMHAPGFGDIYGVGGAGRHSVNDLQVRCSCRQNHDENSPTATPLRTMEDPSPPTAPINTYHCICTTLILATPYGLDELPKRAPPVQDRSAILPLEDSSQNGTLVSRLYNVVDDRKPVIVRREDGFEKRDFLRCSRCHLVIGYKLEDSGADGNVVYILSDGLVTTEKMKTGSTAEEAH